MNLDTHNLIAKAGHWAKTASITTLSSQRNRLDDQRRCNKNSGMFFVFFSSCFIILKSKHRNNLESCYARKRHILITERQWFHLISQHNTRPPPASCWLWALCSQQVARSDPPEGMLTEPQYSLQIHSCQLWVLKNTVYIWTPPCVELTMKAKCSKFYSCIQHELENPFCAMDWGGVGGLGISDIPKYC